MSILSLEFFLFFAIVLLGYYVCPLRWRWVWLLAASLAFYLMADVKYIVFLLASLSTSYVATRLMRPDAQRKNRWLLAAALVLNIGLLAFLKYYTHAAAWIGVVCPNIQFPLFDLIMPLGISYYVLTVTGYCIDVYRGKIQPERNFFKYTLFVSFFPQILQGPIPRYDHLASQLIEGHTFKYVNLAHGLQLMLWGMFKKLVIADWAAIIVATVFDGETYIGSQVILAAVLFSIQLYADFSGCVDIVRGCAQSFGIELGINFDRPYFATSIQDFWHRWHVSLSSWLRDYVYIPLGGSRKGNIRQYINLILTFLISGLWHGVGLQFVVWGLLHGVYQVAGKLLKSLRDKVIHFTGTDRNTIGPRIIQTAFTFCLVTFAWIFFRAPSLHAAVEMVMSIVTNPGLKYLVGKDLLVLGLTIPQICSLAVSVATLFAVSVLQEKGDIRPRLDRQPLLIRWAVYLIGIAVILICGNYGPTIDSSAFIYAQF